MPKRSRLSQPALRECCGAFYVYLQNNKHTSQPMSKENLRNVYLTSFRPNQIRKFPCYSMILFNMRRFHFVNLRNGSMVYFLLTLDENTSDKIGKTSQVSVDQHASNFNESSSTSDAGYSCLICKAHLKDLDDYKKHRQENITRHMFNFNKLLIERMQYANNEITIQFNGQPTLEELSLAVKCNEEEQKTFLIDNNDSTSITFVACEAVHLGHGQNVVLNDREGVTSSRSTTVIESGGSYVVDVKFEAKFAGETLVLFLFQFKKGEDTFNMSIRLRLIVSTDLTDLLKPISEYKRPVNVVLPTNPDFVPGRPLPKSEKRLKYVRGLREYPIPHNLRTTLLGVLGKPTRTIKEKLEEAFPALRNPLSEENHKDRLSVLLHIEELQMEVDINSYNMDSVSMKVVKEDPTLLSLQVLGLAEQRPSIMKGDKLYVRKLKSVSLQEYEGIVHDVRECEVWLGFDKSFYSNYIEGELCKVRFTYNRYPLRLQHRALELSSFLELENFTFPCKDNVSDVPHLPDLKLYNRQLEQNPQQMKAVQMIVCGSSGCNPYVIHGPPGTGKTVTLVEAMKQVAKTNGACHVLACAPSNTAADLIAERLLQHVLPKNIFRIYAVSRNARLIPEKLKNISNYDKSTKQFYFPSREKLMEYQFIVTTLTTAGRLAGAKFSPDHFTHIFIDEAGQAVEPEALVAVAGNLFCTRSNGKFGQLVFAGDPKQLGPIIRSPIARSYGLNKSMLERFMLDVNMYKQYDDRFITKLLQNYRSHKDILTVPNKLFYDNELKVFADIGITHSLCNWDELPKKNFPVIFHSVVGKDEREAESPSFFNTAEVNEVVKYVELLLTARNAGINIKPSDIGIISPYNRQVKKIRQGLQTLMKKKLGNIGKDPTEITIGSTEVFQGQERLVIIISTVRSDTDLLQLDYKFHLGFVRNPKRFNVAVTRAKALLIVIGNPYVLTTDSKWRMFIQHCIDNDSMKGVRFNPESNLKDLSVQLTNLGIGEDENFPDLDESTFLVRINEEHPWNREI